MNVPQNEEHIEANQERANTEREEFKKELTDEERKKMEVVEEAVRLLNNNNIICYLYAWLPSGLPEYEKRPGLWQWNTLGKHLVFDERGKFTEDTMKLLRDVNSDLVDQVISVFFKKCRSPEEVGWAAVRMCAHSYHRLSNTPNPFDVEDNRGEE